MTTTSTPTESAEPTPLPAAPPVPAAPRRRRGLGLLLLLIVMAAVAAAAFWVWQQQQRLVKDNSRHEELIGRLSRNLARLESESKTLDTRQADLVAVMQRNSAETADFGRRIDEHDQVVGNLNEQVVGGRNRFVMASIENLLLLANDRLQIARDPVSALVALQEADQRIASLRDPRLFNVRQAIAEERTALQAVPQPDYTSAALTLSSLSGRAEQLPLRARAPDHYESAMREPAAAVADSTRWERFKASVTQALRGMFTLRRNQGPEARLLAPQDEALVHHVLMLRLEAARAALLRGDTVSFRDACAGSAAWLHQYFRAEDPAVRGALADLDRLRALELSPSLPEITRSLALLRSHMDVPAK
ncbi:MAG TPA: uroporphyrinogen-III C-methyltransferase [Solimonas sp.]